MEAGVFCRALKGFDCLRMVTPKGLNKNLTLLRNFAWVKFAFRDTGPATQKENNDKYFQYATYEVKNSTGQAGHGLQNKQTGTGKIL